MLGSFVVDSFPSAAASRSSAGPTASVSGVEGLAGTRFWVLIDGKQAYSSTQCQGIGPETQPRLEK